MPKIKISPVSAIWIIMLIILKTPYLFPMISAIALHELGHILFAMILKIRIQSFELSLLGARLKTFGTLSYTDEFLLTLGGPLAGMLGFAAVFPIALKLKELPLTYGFFLPFSIMSLSLSIFNIIPLPTLDGGRMLSCLLKRFLPLSVADTVLNIIGFLTLFSLWLFSVYMMIKIESGLAMFIFCVFFFLKCFIFDTKTRDFESF